MARPSLDRNVKFKALIRTLGMPRPFVRGLLETLWDVANECGNPVLGTPQAVEAAAEWPGQLGVLFASLRDCKLIDELSDGIWEIHDYWDHAPEYVKGRMRKEQQRKRDRNGLYVTGQSRDSHGTVTQKSDTPAPAPAPAPAPSGGRNSPRPPSCSEPLAAASEPTATTIVLNPLHPREKAGVNPKPCRPQDRGSASSAPDPAGVLDPVGDPVVLEFPIVGGKGGKGPTEWPLRQSKVAEYQEAFPGLDVLAHCRRALQWVRENSAKRKTSRGMGAFLLRWLGKEQDRGNVRPVSSSNETTAAQRAERIQRDRDRAEQERQQAQQDSRKVREMLDHVKAFGGFGGSREP